MNTSATSISSPFSYQKHTTRDSDQHAESLAQWNQTYNQLSAGPFAGSLVDMWFDGMQVFRETTNRSVSQAGTSWENSYVIGIPLASSGSGLFSKQALPPDALFCFRSNEGFALRTPESFDIVGITLPEAALDDFLNLGSESEVQRILGGPPLVLVPPKEKLDELRTCLSAMFDPSHFEPALLGYPQIQRAMRSAIMGHLVEVLQSASRAPTPAPSFKGRCHVVEQAIDYAMAHLDQAVTVSDLCNRVNVSRRMLNYCFLDVLETNPIQYLRALRLNGVRRELRDESTPVQSIRDVACRWGFWHFSRFAEEYRTLFGELPSETVRHTQRRP